MEKFASRFFAVAILITGALGAAAACSSKSSGGAGPGGGGDGGEAGTTDAPVAPTDPPGMFHALEAELVATCGGAGGQCHVCRYALVPFGTVSQTQDPYLPHVIQLTHP